MLKDFSIRKYFKGDFSIWIIILFLCLISIVMVYSTSIRLSQKEVNSEWHYLSIQLIIVASGIFIMWVVSSFIKPLGILKYSRFFCYLFIILAFMLNIDGLGYEWNGATRSFIIPLIHVSFNPFDFLRIVVILDLTQQLSKRRDSIYKLRLTPNFLKLDSHTNWEIIKDNTFPILFPSCLAVLAALLQNGSTAMLLSFMILIMLLLGNVRKIELLRVLLYGLTLGAIIFCILFALGWGRARTMVNRVDAFINPKEKVENVNQSQNSVKLSDFELRKKYYKDILADPNANKSNYQRTLAKIAMSSGGIFGKGPGNSTLRYILPNSHDDFVYAIIVEEYGLFGGLFVVVLYIALLFRGIKTALRSRYYSLRFLALGLVIQICLTAFLHMMVATGNIFTTGQVLPLISRGGSSFWANSISLGLILSIGARELRKENKETAEVTVEEITESENEDNN